MGREKTVIIVGAGMAGLAAADLLSAHGVDLLILDENPHTGGQFLRPRIKRHGRPRLPAPDRTREAGMRISARLRERKVPVLHGARVLGVFPERRLWAADSRDRILELRPAFLILATGARERFLPFPGWTLPGVLSTGAAQILIKGSGVLPARRMTVGGSGPLMLLVAAAAAAAGGRVSAVLDQGSVARKASILNLGPVHWPRLLQGASALARLALARVPVRSSVRILAAEGKDRLERVVAVRIDRSGRAVPGTERVLPTEALAVGYGFAPNVELASQAGCRIVYSEDLGGWAVDVDASMAASGEGIYAAGEATGIAGAAKSLLEGRIAAASILHRLGRMDTAACRRRTDPLHALRRRELRYGRFLNRLCRVPAACLRDIPDETVICRCEGVTLGDLRREIRSGAASVDALKKGTRAGMGNCQGRICGPILSEVLAAFTGSGPEAAGSLSARAPVRMVPLGAVAEAASFGDEEGDRG